MVAQAETLLQASQNDGGQEAKHSTFISVVLKQVIQHQNIMFCCFHSPCSTHMHMYNYMRMLMASVYTAIILSCPLVHSHTPSQSDTVILYLSRISTYVVLH